MAAAPKIAANGLKKIAKKNITKNLHIFEFNGIELGVKLPVIDHLLRNIEMPQVDPALPFPAFGFRIWSLAF
jgi:hypothetical protein